MDLSIPLHESTREIRSVSIPRLRRSSHLSKFGGPPPKDAFHTSCDPSTIPYRPRTGKPTTNLTPAQKFEIAHNTVPSLIGKHVNRNNQRIGERDPWRCWGPGRKWGKQDKRGDLEAAAGLESLEDEEDGNKEGLANRRDDVGIVLKDGDLPRRRSFETLGAFRWKKHSVKRKRADEQWELVERSWASADECLDESWDVMSAGSAPG
ncbi:MAG: hypothetical protein Q9226_005270 [Calogaya cf. arnoldii]